MAADECAEATGDKQEGEQGQRRPGEVGLEGRGPWKLSVSVDSLLLATVVESEVDDADDEPVHQCSNCYNITQPLKDYGCWVGEGHIPQAHEASYAADSHIRDREAVQPFEYCRSMSMDGHAIENAGPEKDIGIASGPSRCNDNSVDDRGCDLDPCPMSRDNKWGLRSRASQLKKSRII